MTELFYVTSAILTGGNGLYDQESLVHTFYDPSDGSLHQVHQNTRLVRTRLMESSEQLERNQFNEYDGWKVNNAVQELAEPQVRQLERSMRHRKRR